MHIYIYIHVYCVLCCCSVIIVSELGDKTFFIAAIMAMRHARATVFSGAIAALGVMHVSIECILTLLTGQLCFLCLPGCVSKISSFIK